MSFLLFFFTAKIKYIKYAKIKMYTYFFSISQHYIIKTQLCLCKLHVNLCLRFVHYI